MYLIKEKEDANLSTKETCLLVDGFNISLLDQCMKLCWMSLHLGFTPAAGKKGIAKFRFVLSHHQKKKQVFWMLDAKQVIF